MSIFIRFWFPLLVYSGMIFYVSSMPALDAPQVMPHADKFFHLGAYFPFGFLAARALVGTSSGLTGFRLGLGAVGLTALYAVSDEFHQMFVPGRTASAGDVMADVIGGILGVLVYQIIFLKSRKS